MSGDYSRKRFNPEKHYQGVLRQQGRVDLDADWNEYVDLQDRRWRAETIDVVGRCGVSAETPDGFKIGVNGGELTVGQGRMYVDGYVAENHGTAPALDATIEEPYGTAALLVKDQPFGGPVTIPPQVRSLVYLDVWRREVTHLQAPDLIEPAVNVDSTTRNQTAWQVRILGGIPAEVHCKTPLEDIPGWPAGNRPSTARLTTTTVAVTTDPDLCLVPPTGGYRGLENHLYRVEVHNATNTTAKVKWSRENAHVSTTIVEILAGRTTVRVDSLGHDNVLRFKTEDWVEFTSDGREFAGVPGEMRKVTVDDTNKTLTFSPALPIADFPEGVPDETEHLRVIRWDQSGIVRKPDGSQLVNLDLMTDGLIELSAANPSFVLEYGVQATLTVQAGGTARSGDYWCFAARTADADIERLNLAPPLGLYHHYCHLAIIETDGTIHDCRPKFPALTELTSLFYVGGDGQEALLGQGQKLPKPMQVGVASGKRPVAGASVRFHVTGGNGSLSGGSASGNDINVLTDSQGVAACDWTLDGGNPAQQVEAMLADGSHLPVRFNATLSQPGGAEPGVHVKGIFVAGDPLLNDTEVSVDQLIEGITISCDDGLFKGSVLNKPVCFVTLEMPFPLNAADIALWGSAVVGFQPLVLAATVNSELESIFWLATKPCVDWLGQLFDVLAKQKQSVERLLARLTVKGNFIWGEKNPNLYLDGEVFGVAASGGAVTAVKLLSGDNRQGGDLEMWFWLVPKKATNVTISIKPATATVAPRRSVNFTVDVQGATDKTVTVRLDPPTGSGAIEQSNEKPNSWTYTAPQSARLKLNVVATSNADRSKHATAVVTVKGGGQDIAVAISPTKAILEPADPLDFTVTVQNGDVTKIDMTVHGEPNGNTKFGTIVRAPRKGPGVWSYHAPGSVPVPNQFEIVAISQEDTTQFAKAQVTIGPVMPQLDSAGAENSRTEGTKPTSGGGRGGTSPRSRPRT